MTKVFVLSPLCRLASRPSSAIVCRWRVGHCAKPIKMPAWLPFLRQTRAASSLSQTHRISVINFHANQVQTSSAEGVKLALNYYLAAKW